MSRAYHHEARRGRAPEGSTLCPTTGKWGWPTSAAAERVLATVRANPNIPRPPRRVYECPWCGDFHLTGRPRA